MILRLMAKLSMMWAMRRWPWYLVVGSWELFCWRHGQAKSMNFRRRAPCFLKYAPALCQRRGLWKRGLGGGVVDVLGRMVYEEAGELVEEDVKGVG